MGTNCIVNIWKLWISLSNSEWIWVYLLCYKSGKVNYSVFNICVNSVRWEQALEVINPFVTLDIINRKLRGSISIAAVLHPGVTATNHPDERSSAPCIIHTRSRRSRLCPKCLKSSHIVRYKYRPNHLSLLYDRWYQHNKKKGQQNYVYIWLTALWLSYSFLPNKKQPKKKINP